MKKVPQQVVDKTRRQRSLGNRLCLLLLSMSVISMSVTGAAVAQRTSAPEPQTGTVIGTVTDVNDATVPGATVVLEGPSLTASQRVKTGDDGFFKLEHLDPGTPYHVTVSASGFADWSSPEVILRPGQYMDLTGIRLRIAAAITTVNALLSTEELATEQVKLEEKQRVLGFIPNFYVVYDHNAVPLTPKLKFRLALKTSIDPVTFAGAAFVSGIDQASDTPNYQQGTKGYGQRLGANYANGLTDILIGGAILPSILHQDPRYFYQGTGTKKSRALHALSTPFICKGDNGRWQPNFSGLGGYLASGALSNTYYPESNRGPGLVFSTTFIDIAADMANGVIQEFVLRKLTSTARSRHQSDAGSN
ncbi:carboxypeptidase-like regulatory domain-containing protein [Tunturiibacter gelidiferens]|uniref:Carboxypeptidase-like regulatory domain-containing protein n=1 Tax=Tunturiibacter gelidiferens TaxID=3069689 RepID=A0AAU7Z333_9BACT